MRTYQNLINGTWTPAASGNSFTTRNPANTDEVVAQYASGNATDAQNALHAARQAFPAWASTTPVARGRILARTSQILESRKNELGELLTREEGKTLPESLGEVQRAIDIFRFFGGLSYTLGGQTIPHDLPNILLYTQRQALGVVALITPWNFPVAIPAWKLAPALLCGNAVVLKPASLAPAMSLELGRALCDAGLPKGVLNIVIGDGRSVGNTLAEDPRVVALSFTGSYTVGQGIYQKLAARMARPQLEMGGKNPTIVLADADLDLAANLVVKAGFGLTGQACTATSRVIVEQPVLEPFIAQLLAKTTALKVGNGLEAGIDMGPAVSQDQLDSNLRYVEVAQQQGARLICGGHRLSDSNYSRGFFMAPTLLADVKPDHRIACEEVFGPVIALIAAQDFQQAMTMANSVDVGLSASVVTRDLKRAMHFADHIEAGVIKINQISTGLALQAPFGGVKKSSTDSFREQGPQAIDFYSRLRTVYLDYSA